VLHRRQVSRQERCLVRGEDKKRTAHPLAQERLSLLLSRHPQNSRLVFSSHHYSSPSFSEPRTPLCSILHVRRRFAAGLLSPLLHSSNTIAMASNNVPKHTPAGFTNQLPTTTTAGHPITPGREAVDPISAAGKDLPKSNFNPKDDDPTKHTTSTTGQIKDQVTSKVEDLKSKFTGSTEDKKDKCVGRSQCDGSAGAPVSQMDGQNCCDGQDDEEDKEDIEDTVKDKPITCDKEQFCCMNASHCQVDGTKCCGDGVEGEEEDDETETKSCDKGTGHCQVDGTKCCGDGVEGEEEDNEMGDETGAGQQCHCHQPCDCKKSGQDSRIQGTSAGMHVSFLFCGPHLPPFSRRHP
jgi:hypothetical protein